MHQDQTKTNTMLMNRNMVLAQLGIKETIIAIEDKYLYGFWFGFISS